MLSRLSLSSLLIVLLACGGPADANLATVTASRGTVVRKAIATGFVEPDREARVNTALGGIVRHVHVALGDKVQAGAPLVEVWPALTERDLLRAERSLQAAVENERAAREYVAGAHLLATLTRWLQGEPTIDRMEKAAERRVSEARENLELLRSGKAVIGGRSVDFVVRAPMAGHVLELAHVGDPVTPRSAYGNGTVVAVIGDLDKPVFRGSVDEIDVGRLKAGMPARITLGALPDVTLSGRVVEIGLLAQRQDGASRFDVRVEIDPPPDTVALRAGFSAVAEVELGRAEDTLVVPERVLRFEAGRPWVLVREDDGSTARHDVELGLGDGLLVEVQNGLNEGDVVLEPRGASR